MAKSVGAKDFIGIGVSIAIGIVVYVSVIEPMITEYADGVDADPMTVGLLRLISLAFIGGMVYGVVRSTGVA